MNTAFRLTLLAALAATLSGCNALQRISEIGGAPTMSDIRNPNVQPGYTPVSLPMPAPQIGERQPNSLWRAGARAFFKDQRAGRIGDILTVTININDKANLSNESDRTRDNSDKAALPQLFGVQGNFKNVFPSAVDATSLVNATSTTSNKGTGKIQRNETIQLQVAALVTEVLPNGNLVLHGRQEMRVNFELRELQIAGVIRPEDISSQNTISYEKIAEARISYGGKGQMTDFQQPRYGQQLFDVLMPW